MATSFLSKASKSVTDVRTFLRENASNNSIKYSAEKGAKHLLYIPYTVGEEEATDGELKIVKRLIAISGNVHEYHTSDGKYKATICLKDVNREEDGIVINDGTCPYCDRVQDAWEVYNYRKEQEEITCKLTGEERKTHLESANRNFADSRKSKDARSYMYVLVVKYKYAANKIVISDVDNLPEFELKVMKLSTSRLTKLTETLGNSGLELEGSELLFQYPNVDDPRLQVSQSTTSPVFKTTVQENPELEKKIQEAISKFDWEGIPKSFQEWNGQSTGQAKKETDILFEKWDEYKVNLIANPAARYMEYITNIAVTNPQLTPGGVVTPTLEIPGTIDINNVLGGNTNEIKL